VHTLARRLGLLLVGCLVLGTGVSMLLSADLGSDGYSTLVNGVARGAGIPFVVANLLVALVFLALAAVRRVPPGVGTVVQVAVVGATVSWLLPVIGTPESLAGRIVLLAAAFPVLSVGVASYLGSQLGAGPAEGAALAWDPPVPFRWSYSAVQGGGALLGWLLGATLGAGTIAVILLLGPGIDVAGRALRLDLRQDPSPPSRD
jgi:uncharacterized membrane protein YczE